MGKDHGEEADDARSSQIISQSVSGNAILTFDSCEMKPNNGCEISRSELELSRARDGATGHAAMMHAPKLQSIDR